MDKGYTKNLPKFRLTSTFQNHMMSRNCGDSAVWYSRNKIREVIGYKVYSYHELRKKNETKKGSKRGNTHQVCHSNHKINASDKKMY